MQLLAREADRQNMQQAMEQQAADHESHCQSLSATSQQTLRRLRQENEAHLQQMSAEKQAALDEASKMLATSRVISS